MLFDNYFIDNWGTVLFDSLFLDNNLAGKSGGGAIDREDSLQIDIVEITLDGGESWSEVHQDSTGTFCQTKIVE